MRRLNECGFVDGQSVSDNIYHLANCFLLKPVIRLILAGCFFGKLNGLFPEKIARAISSRCEHQIASSSASAAVFTHNSSASNTCPRKLLDSASRLSITSCTASREAFKQKPKSPISFVCMPNCRAAKTVSNGANSLEVMGLVAWKGRAGA